jgi:2-polyprenyl-6-hydroxyphenyl methylase/3-demethylubiquinone-9 3-methyltransferase
MGGAPMQRVCDHIDNTLYNAKSDTWWQPDSALYLLKTTVNPVRVGYVRKKLFDELKIEPQGKSALEVGCGGGILCEEIAAMGFETTGIDPSERSLHFAGEHSRQSGLNIRYDTGSGEALPYGDNSFDVVFCCDVLEHVSDPNRVISEISRVLKRGGVFCYDTINRTFISKLVAIRISQQWKRWAFMPPGLHCWEMFIKPDELIQLLRSNDLEWQGHRGVGIKGPIPKILGYLRKRARGEWGYKDLGERLLLVESFVTGVMYMGYAIKR